jgi:molybdopterin synthase sulfur carrier subunit
MLSIKYFASLREQLGCGGEQVELPVGVSNVGELRAHLAKRGGEWVRLTTTRNLRCACNQDMASDPTPVKDGDEVAFFPPVTGG